MNVAVCLKYIDTWNETAIKAAWDKNTPEESKGFLVYVASKTEGERAAYNWVKKNNPSFIFNSVLPDFTVRVFIFYYDMII